MTLKKFFLILSFISSLALQNFVIASGNKHHGQEDSSAPKINYFPSQFTSKLLLKITVSCPLEILRNLGQISQEIRTFIYNSPDVYKPHIQNFSKIYDKEKNLFDFSHIIIENELSNILEIFDPFIFEKRSINLSETSIKNEQLKRFFQGSDTINLSGCNQITDEGIKYLAGVRTINLSGCNQVTEEGRKALTGASTIYDEAMCDTESTEIENCTLNDAIIVLKDMEKIINEIYLIVKS